MPWVVHVNALMNAAPAPQTSAIGGPSGHACAASAKIDHRSVREVSRLCLQIAGGTDWSAVRVLDHRRYSRPRGGLASSRKVFPVDCGRIHEVDVRVDEAGHDQ
jgi:hypothetical protein